MATVHVTLNSITDRATTGQTMPVPDSAEVDAETLTSSGTSAASTIATTSANNQFWELTATGGNVFVKFGATPTAASNAGHLLLNGQTRAWASCAVGEKVAIIDA